MSSDYIIPTAQKPIKTLGSTCLEQKKCSYDLRVKCVVLIFHYSDKNLKIVIIIIIRYTACYIGIHFFRI